MSTITFRTAQPTDWPAIASLLSAANLPLDGAQDHLSEFVLALRADELIGTAALEKYGGYGLLRSVAVIASEHRRGLGAALTQQLIDRARRDQLRGIVLLTTTASDYFPRFGFARIDRADVPLPVQASIEFQSACPQSAVAMLLDLSTQNQPHASSIA
jgi:amino-acid N-acetyltransferase